MAEVGRLGRGGTGASVEGSTLVVKGLTELQKGLRKADVATAVEVRTGLREIGDKVRDKAKGNVTNRTGRGTGALAGSLKTSATLSRVSVYSDLPHSRVQDTGGQVGRGRSTLLTRASVSQYMTRAVDAAEHDVDASVETLLTSIQTALDGDSG
jgi:hypothetical protein